LKGLGKRKEVEDGENQEWVFQLQM
jgi:hypothetical protein